MKVLRGGAAVVGGRVQKCPILLAKWAFGNFLAGMGNGIVPN